MELTAWLAIKWRHKYIVSYFRKHYEGKTTGAYEEDSENNNWGWKDIVLNSKYNKNKQGFITKEIGVVTGWKITKRRH